MLDSLVMNWQTCLPNLMQHFSLPMYPSPLLLSMLQHCKDEAHQVLYLETKSFSLFSFVRLLWFLQRNWSFPALNCLSHSLCPLTYALCRIKCKDNSCAARSSTAKSNSPPSGLPCLWTSGLPCLVLLTPSLISDPDLEAWHDCWVSTKFLYAPIPWKGLSSTTTRKSNAGLLTMRWTLDTQMVSAHFFKKWRHFVNSKALNSVFGLALVLRLSEILFGRIFFRASVVDPSVTTRPCMWNTLN